MVCCGVVSNGLVWCVVVWCGVIQHHNGTSSDDPGIDLIDDKSDDLGNDPVLGGNISTLKSLANIGMSRAVATFSSIDWVRLGTATCYSNF